MKNIFPKLLAFAAAGLLVFGAAVPFSIVKAGTDCSDFFDDENLDPDGDWFYYEVVKSPIPWIFNLPEWTEDMAQKPNKPIDNTTVKPGEFYIHRYVKYTGYDSNPVYFLIHIDEIPPKEVAASRFRVRTVKYTEIHQSKSGSITLEDHQFDMGNSSVRLYAVPH
ncbi:MAG: hypothetical protein HUJ54_08070 [Erysipelotrichaceae bacterium]|nr:hypothetical protein [Erysipelotrichaceae bacterium]